MSQVGDPPPLRGDSPEDLRRFAIACRASAVVLQRQGHMDHAVRLRCLADAADYDADLGRSVIRRPAA